jgi:hypothetical protein
VEKKDVKEFGKKVVTAEIINFAGTTPEDFKKADIPTGRELSLEEKKMLFRKKRYAKVTISVKAESGDAETSSVVDEFNLYVVTNKHSDNVKTIQIRLENIKPLIEQLVKNWEGEI